MGSCRGHLLAKFSPGPPTAPHHRVDQNLATEPQVSSCKEVSHGDSLITCDKDRVVLQREQIRKGSSLDTHSRLVIAGRCIFETHVLRIWCRGLLSGPGDFGSVGSHVP